MGKKKMSEYVVTGHGETYEQAVADLHSQLEAAAARFGTSLPDPANELYACHAELKDQHCRAACVRKADFEAGQEEGYEGLVRVMDQTFLGNPYDVTQVRIAQTFNLPEALLKKAQGQRPPTALGDAHVGYIGPTNIGDILRR